MNTRKLGLGLAAALILPASAQAQEVILKVAHFLTPTTPAHARFIAPWCDRIAAESQGRMKCQIYPAMQLGGTPPQLLNQVRDGVADIVWTLPGYTPGRFPITEVFELPFFSTSYGATSRALWDFVEGSAASEFSGLRPIAVWTAGPYLLHFRSRQVNTLDDLKGLKVRTPSRLGNRMLAALGATPVGMPAPQMTEGLAKGVIDGALLPWEVVPALKIQELTRYHAEPTGEIALNTATTIFVMGQKKYDSLPDDLKKVIDDNRGREVSAFAATQLEEAGKSGREATAGNGNTIYQIAPAELERWKQATAAVAEEWIKDISDKGMDGRRLHAEAAGLVKKYSH